LIWCDSRAIEECDWIRENIGLEVIHRICGNTIAPYFGGPKWLWFRNNEPGLSAHHVFESLLGREKLGSTGLGHGVALPHGRSSDISQARLAVIKLARGIDYDAPDTKPVDLLFALIVPEESTEEHLQILAMLAEMLADEKFLMQLRQTSDCDALFRLLTHWKKASNAA